VLLHCWHSLSVFDDDVDNSMSMMWMWRKAGGDGGARTMMMWRKKSRQDLKDSIVAKPIVCRRFGGKKFKIEIEIDFGGKKFKIEIDYARFWRL